MAAALESVQGVKDAVVAAGGLEATVVREAGSGSDADLTDAVKRAGYGAWVIPTQKVELAVTGLECSGCETKADAAIRRVKGTRRVRVSKKARRATVVYETKRASTTKIMQALKKAGFASRKVG